MEMKRKGLVEEEEASTWQGKYLSSGRKTKNLQKKVGCYLVCCLGNSNYMYIHFAEPEEAVLSYDEVTQEESKASCK